LENQHESFGTFNFGLTHTWVHKHTSRQYPGDPIENQLAYDSGYDIPRSKSTGSITWTLDRLTLYGLSLL